MNKKGRAAVEILIMLIAVAIASAIVFLLVKYGVIEVKEVEGASVLDTEFIPYTREGYLTVKGFKFCGFVDEKFNCIGEKDVFNRGDDIHFKFLIESSTVDGAVMLVENYQLKGPMGDILLEVDERYNNYFEMKGAKEREIIPFKDYLVGEEEDDLGEYTFELIIENPLLNKKVTLVKEFEII